MCLELKFIFNRIAAFPKYLSEHLRHVPLKDKVADEILNHASVHHCLCRRTVILTSIETLVPRFIFSGFSVLPVCLLTWTRHICPC